MNRWYWWEQAGIIESTQLTSNLGRFMNSSLASPAVQLAKAHSERNEVVRIDSEINSHSPDQLSTVWPIMVQQFGVTPDGGKEKRPNSKLTKARQSKGSNHPPQAVPQRRYMVVDGLGVARALAIMEERGRCRRST